MNSDLVFAATFDVRRGEGSIMPDGVSAAYVTCFAAGPGYRSALENCAATLATDGLRVEQILEPVHSMNVSEWQQFVSSQWPEQADQMPGQVEFESVMNAGKVQYGPFVAYQL